ncbi:GNAT family N-acetyltransferase [soil metagenome]
MTAHEQAAITFEPAVAEDFEALLALRIEAMRESLENIGRFDPMRARERFAAGFSPTHTRHILRADERVGFVVVKPQGEALLLLDHLYIRPQAQGCGIGASVVAQVLAGAAGAGCAVRVGALRGSRSNAFYGRAGFSLVEQAEFDNYYVWPSP